MSAILSNYAPLDPFELLQIGRSNKPIFLLPGMYFGLVVCIAIFLIETRDAVKLALAFVAVVIAWICAWRTGSEIYLYLEKLHSGAPDRVGIPYPYAVAGFIAGIVGSLITVVGVSFASRGFRTAANWTRTILIGALAGLLLQLQPTSEESLLPLFLVWQPAVAASIAYGLAKARSLASGTIVAAPA